ncbi:amidohydrolase family protein [Mycolicibacterium confluentis]|uniref:Amidohydrolase-related domain-containing protein n=1 Tax=Mycolicibacterium confluentis TaxID=28047 RepID=A0A7I7XWJ7_9MYCO|nr:amidohydrolase family protein [Mycolicibacterium confluentis]MCV7321723.1 amidohydrolase family protein [Mycolicibacterium confluentis]ORV32005.1 amidohydrolase [Mycolicibacterium confluentis]BBZ33534.1 hypothetical protein MCNF_21390 [Mycolicibacterium confluentis]
MTTLADHINAVELIDHHVHGFWTGDGDQVRFHNALNEADTEPLAEPDAVFDSQLGFAVRTHCAPVLGLPAHSAPQDYWERRNRMGEAEVTEKLLRRCGVTDWIVDTGFADGVAGPDEVARASGGRAHEVVRLEQVAEQAAAASGSYGQAFTEILSARAEHAVGTKSILAYRGGFEGDLSEPNAHEVAEAAARWRDEGGKRLTDRTLLRFGLHQGLRLGKPLQIHVGFGDRDLDLHRANPLLLLDFLRSSGDTPITLLHCYPFEREAGYLAQAFDNVFVDVGLSVNHLGARSPSVIARLLELAPFRKILYSSDAFGPAELHFLGARLWRIGMTRVLTGFVESGEWSRRDAVRVVDLIAHRNARRIYPQLN